MKFSIDGTYQKKTFMIYANDETDRKANCIARSFKTREGHDFCRPFIVTKRDVPMDEELVYSYGDYEYDWRKVHTGNYCIVIAET
jgi:hypothetical protein